MKYRKCPLCGIPFCKPIEFTNEQITKAKIVSKAIQDEELKICSLCGCGVPDKPEP